MSGRKFALAETLGGEGCYQLEDNDERLTGDYLDFYAIPTTYFTYSNNGGAEGSNVLANAFDRNFQTTFASNSTQNNGVLTPTPEQVFLNNIDVNFANSVKIDRIIYASGQRYNTPWGYPTLLSIFIDNGDGNGLRLFKKFSSSATTKFVLFDFEQELEACAIRLEYTSLLKSHSWKATAREIMFLQKESDEYEIYKNLFTDYAQTKLNVAVDSYQNICDFENNLKNNVNFKQVNDKIERAKKVANGEIEFDEKLEFSTNPNAKNVINRYGNLESYCRNTLLLSSFGTNRQVTGISANANDVVTVFVDAQEGDPLPRLRFSQHMGHWRKWLGGEVQLKKGKNTFTVPSYYHEDYTVDVTLGGGIYISNPYTQDQQSGDVKVYIEGGTLFPVLSSNVSDEEYLAEVDRYCEKYESDPDKYVNITEIVTDHMIVTVDCTKAKEIYSSFSPSLAVENWNEYMDKLLEFGGISQNSKSAVFDDRNLNIQFNIRITQHWSGGWMYAYSEHIGVRQDSQNGLLYGSGFGWGVSHEIGHTLDNRLRIIGETTNNMWAKYNETVIEKACTRGDFEKTLKTLSNDESYDDGNFFVDNEYNYLIWWYIEAWQNGYWGNLENCYRGLNPTLNNFLNKNKDLKEKVNSLSPTELQVLYSSIVTKVDLSYYFDRWGYSVQNNESDPVFKIQSASDNFKEIMNRAVKQKFVDNSKEYKLWYQDCYYYHTANKKSTYTNKFKPTISVVAKTSQGYGIFINHKNNANHIGYEILEGNDSEGYKVICFIKENYFVDTTNYPDGYQPKYKVRAVDNSFSLSGESRAKEAENSTKNVCKIDTTYFTSLQNAISNAETGDTIQLLSSMLSVNVVIDKNLTIKIADEVNREIVITKIESGNLFTISSGVTLTICGKPKANLILDGNKFTQNGSLMNVAGVVNGDNLTMRNNIASSNGGAITLQNNSKGSIFKNCLISNNRADNGGGVFCGYPAISVTFEGCAFDKNVAVNDGIIKNKGTMTINDCKFTNNSIARGTINNYDGGVLTVKDCSISNNSAKIGAGLYIDGKTEIANCKIFKNKASEKGGGVFYSTNLGGSRFITINNVEFSKNVAPDGNDIVIEKGRATLTGVKTYSGSQILLVGGEIKIKDDCDIQSKIKFLQSVNLILQDGLFKNINRGNFHPEDVEVGEEIKVFTAENFELIEDDLTKFNISNGSFDLEIRENSVYCLKTAQSANQPVSISAEFLVILAIAFISTISLACAILIKKKKRKARFTEEREKF